MIKKRGFTLVELLVTVAIVAIMMIVSIPAFGKYGERQKINQAAEEVAETIRKAQNLALAPPNTKHEEVDAYAIRCSNGARGYYLQCYHKNNNVYTACMCNQDRFWSYQSFVLPGNEIYFQSGCNENGGYNSTNKDVLFQIPSGKISNTENIEIVLRNNKLSNNNTNIKKIKVNRETGQIEIK